MVKQFLKSVKSDVSQMTWKGSMRRSACLEAAERLRAKTRARPLRRQSLWQRLSKWKAPKRCHPGRRSRSGTPCRKVL